MWNYLRLKEHIFVLEASQQEKQAIFSPDIK